MVSNFSAVASIFASMLNCDVTDHLIRSALKADISLDKQIQAGQSFLLGYEKGTRLYTDHMIWAKFIMATEFDQCLQTYKYLFTPDLLK